MSPLRSPPGGVLCPSCQDNFSFSKPYIVDQVLQYKEDTADPYGMSDIPPSKRKYLRAEIEKYRRATQSYRRTREPGAGFRVPSPWARDMWNRDAVSLGTGEFFIWYRPDHERAWGDLRDSARLTACLLCDILLSMFRYAMSGEEPPSSSLIESYWEFSEEKDRAILEFAMDGHRISFPATITKVDDGTVTKFRYLPSM